MRPIQTLLVLMFLGAHLLGCEPSAPPKKETPASGETALTAGGESAAKDAVVAEKQKRPTAEDTATDQSVAEAPTTADFAVHEWGMTRYFSGQLMVSTSAPKRERLEPVEKPKHHREPEAGVPKITRPNVTTAKPLVMLHPGPTFDLDTELSVSVELVGGTFREVWPTPALGPQPQHSSTYTWRGVRATAEPCGRELAPPADHVGCTSIAAGGLCEAAEMSLYLSPVASCLQVGDDRTPALVYNGLSPDVAAPLAFGGGAPETIKNQTGFAIGPLYLHQGDALLRIEKLDANSVLELSEATPFDGELKAVLKRDLLAKGLTEGEADSFVAAWSPDVLRQPWVWQVFGFYSPEGLEAVAPMTITPKPSSIVRVMAMTIE